MQLSDDKPVTPGQGQYKYTAIVTTGPILIQSRMKGASSFNTVTDGSIAASEDKLISIASLEEIKVQLGASDEFYLSIVESGLD